MNLWPFLWTLGPLAVTLIVFFAFGTLAKARLREQYRPVGQMIDIGGYRLHMHVEGRGNPTVVFDTGAGGIGLSWELVRPAIANVTRVVVYDRAGLGWSDSSPRPRTADVMAEELHSMLIKASIPGPYVLVGHSLGGPVTRQFAVKYPDEVIGLVMVDSAHEQQVKYFPEQLVKMVNSMKSMMGVMKVMSKLGIFALKPSLVSIGDNGKLSSELVAQMQGVIASSDSHAETLIAETESVYAARTQSVATLADLPLTVICHGRLDVNAVPPSLGPEIRDEYELAWQNLQREIASLSTRGKLIVAERSGHNVPFDQPELIVESVLQLVQEAWHFYRDPTAVVGKKGKQSDTNPSC